MTKRGLIICGHGSRRDGWNQRFIDLVEQVRAEHSFQDKFHAGVETGFLENASPTLHEAAVRLQERGANHISVIPVFLSASVHLSEDLPEEISRLDQEGCPVKLISGPALPETLGSNALDRAQAFPADPNEAGIVLIYNGSARFAQRWNELITTVGSFLLSHGYAYVDSAPIGHVVESRCEPTHEAIERTLSHVKRAIVIPLLVSISAYQEEIIPAAIEKLSSEQKRRTDYQATSILPDARLTQWLIGSAVKNEA